MTETIKNWLTQLYEREIKEALGSISNERIWLMGTDVWEEEKMHLDNMENLNEYIVTLKTLMNDIKDDEVREWAKREGYDIFDDEEEEETEIRYFICGLGYDANGRITDYERSFGDFDDKDEAQDKFDEVVSEAEEFIDEFFENAPYEVACWKIQLEKCECTDGYDECVDVLDEYDIKRRK